MTIYYVDLAGGNDANDGSSFTLRKKTLGFTNTLLPGDTVRVAKTAAPALLFRAGNATHTEGGGSITLTSSLNDTIDHCNSGWVGSANVLASNAATTRKIGTVTTQLTPQAAFTTGKIAYKTLPATLNPTNTSGVSFWIRRDVGVTIPSGTLTMSLCSDTQGNTPVSTFTVPAFGPTWMPVKIAGATGSGINSVSFSVANSVGSFTFLISNIVTYDAGASGITHQSMISVDQASWFHIRSIDGPIITFDTYSNSIPTEIAYFAGPTVTGPVYKIEPVQIPVGETIGQIASIGTSAAMVNILFGWDNAAQTANGTTFFAGAGNSSYGLSLTCSYTQIQNFHASRFVVGVGNSGNVEGNIISGDAICNSSYGLQVQSTSGFSKRCSYTLNNLSYNGYVSSILAAIAYAFGTGVIIGASSENYISVANMIGNGGNCVTAMGSTTYAYNETISNETIFIGRASYNHGGLSTGPMSNSTFVLNRIDNQQGAIAPVLAIGTMPSNPTNAPAVTGAVSQRNKFIFGELNIGNVRTVIAIGPSIDNELDFSNSTISGAPPLAAFAFIAAAGGGKTYVTGVDLNALGYKVFLKTHELIMVNSTLDVANNLILGTNDPFDLSKISFQNYANANGDCRSYSPAGSISTDTVTSISGISWKITPTTVAGIVSANTPLAMPLAQAYVTNGKPVTVSVMIYRTNDSQSVKLFVEHGSRHPIAVSTQSVLSGTGSGTWQKLSWTVTPARSGVAKIHVGVYNSPGQSVYVDNVSISQA